jgi:subtilisin family serine protease
MDLARAGPGHDRAIPTLFDPTGYATLDGTSFSAPLVSGAAAAVWTLRPTLSNTQLFEVMRRSRATSASAAGTRTPATASSTSPPR